MKQLVEDWMTKNPLKVDVNENAATAEEIMRDEVISHVLVTQQGRLVGVLSAKDLSLVEKIKSRFESSDCGSVNVTVGDLMGRHPATVSGQDTMTDAIRLMNEKGYHSLPVLDTYGRVRGILTSTDVMRYALVASQLSEAKESYLGIVQGV